LGLLSNRNYLFDSHLRELCEVKISNS
jgi:hypothetical protein